MVAGLASAATVAAPSASTSPAEAPATVPPPSPEHPTRWMPLDRELDLAAEGSLGVCRLAVLPIVWIPQIGDVASTAAEVVCFVPAVMAVDYVGTFHGDRDGDLWQAALAIGVKKGWELVVDVPILVGSALLASGVVAVTPVVIESGVPVSVAVAGGLVAVLGGYYAARAGRDAVGDLLFRSIYLATTSEVSGAALADEMRESWVQPRPGPSVATFGAFATAQSARPRFRWAHLVPVVGPIWQAHDRAEDAKGRMRRYAAEVLGYDDTLDLREMDAWVERLDLTAGYSTAAGHVGLIAGAGCFGAALGLSLLGHDVETAETVGLVGLGAAALGGLLIGVAEIPKTLRGPVMSAAFAGAE
jgi:hypothetical protein